MTRKFILPVFLLSVSLLSACSSTKRGIPLDSQRSKIEFIAVKEDGKQVPGIFRNMDGFFKFTSAAEGEELQGEVTVDISSLDTQNAARDNNIRTLFFETEKNPAFKTAKFQITGKLSRKDIPIGGGTFNLQGNLELHGKSAPLTLPVMVNADKGVEVKTISPVEIDFATWDFMGVVPALMKACNHKSLEPKASLNLDLFFKN